MLNCEYWCLYLNDGVLLAFLTAVRCVGFDLESEPAWGTDNTTNNIVSVSLGARSQILRVRPEPNHVTLEAPKRLRRETEDGPYLFVVERLTVALKGELAVVVLGFRAVFQGPICEYSLVFTIGNRLEIVGIGDRKIDTWQFRLPSIGIGWSWILASGPCDSSL